MPLTILNWLKSLTEKRNRLWNGKEVICGILPMAWRSLVDLRISLWIENIYVKHIDFQKKHWWLGKTDCITFLIPAYFLLIMVEYFRLVPLEYFPINEVLKSTLSIMLYRGLPCPWSHLQQTRQNREYLNFTNEKAENYTGGLWASQMDENYEQ